MQELDLLQTYLVRLRQERLQQGHAAALVAQQPGDLVNVVARAHEAELVQRILSAVKDLDKDPGLFIRNHLTQP
jgi:chorismate mutase